MKKVRYPGGLPEDLAKYFDNPRFKKVLQKWLSLDSIEIDDQSLESLGLDLTKEMPDDLEDCDIERLIVVIPGRYAFYCRIRDMVGREFKQIERNRKNRRSDLYLKAISGNGENIPSKLTEKAIDAWIESDDNVTELNLAYDNAETEYMIMCSACEALKLYIDCVQKIVYSRSIQERYTEVPKIPRELRDVEDRVARKEKRLEQGTVGSKDKLRMKKFKKKRKPVVEDNSEYSED